MVTVDIFRLALSPAKGLKMILNKYSLIRALIPHVRYNVRTGYFQAFFRTDSGTCPRTRIHPVHVRILEDETRFLTPEQAATADAALAEAAPGLTFGELRAAAHKLVLKLDPEAAKKRKEAARGEAHVRRFREQSGEHRHGSPGAALR